VSVSSRSTERIKGACLEKWAVGHSKTAAHLFGSDTETTFGRD
jgi:hypothetical protein